MTVASAARKVPPGRPLGKSAGAATRGHGGQGVAVVPPNPSSGAPPKPHRARVTPLTPMRAQAAKSMSKLADHLKETSPDLPAHQHLRDAARTLREGNEEASQRHLRAAMFSLTPQSLLRNGQHTDDAHLAARQGMHGLHRHLLLVKDIADVAAKNQAAIARDSYGGGAPLTRQPDPDAGYGPGALAQKPAVRQPPGDQALNAPARTGSGGSDPNAADPAGPQPKGSKQFANGLNLSAETGRLAATPSPRGKPGGPGLYGVKGNMHSPYLQNIVKALIRKGMDPGRAYAVAWGSMRKWSKGGGKVHPEVRAAAAGGLALEKVAEARAMANCSAGTELARTWGEVGNVVELVTRPGYAGVIELDWAAWDAGDRGGGSAKAHDTASATASRNAKAKIAADKLRQVAGQADQRFPSAGAGQDIHAAADAFTKGDAQGAHQHLDDARTKIRGASEAKGKRVGRDPIANDQNDLDSTLRTGQGQAQMMAQQQDDDARAAAKAAKKAAKAQNHAVSWDEVARVVELAAAPPPASSQAAGKVQPRVPAGQAGGGRFGAGSGQPDAHQQHLAHVAHVAAQQKQGQKPAGSATAGKTASATAKAKIAAGAQSKAGLLKQAAGFRARADQLIAQRKALQAQLASASGAVSSGQSGSTTSAGASTTSSGASTTASTAPAAGSTAAAATPAAAAATTTTTPSASTTAQITAQVAQLGTQIIALQKQYAQTMAAAAKL